MFVEIPKQAITRLTTDGKLEHVVTAHAKMSKDEWQEAYRTAWGIFYTEEHLETVLRRAYACGINIRSLMPVLFWFSSAVPVENLHPLQWGIFRIKRRTDRRSGLPLESPIPFYARYAAEMSRKALALAKRWRMLKAIVRKIESDPNAKAYMDGAMTPVAEEDSEHMEIYTQNEAARTAVERERRVAAKPGTGHAVHAGNGNGHAGNGHHDHDDHHAHEHEEPRPEASPPA